MNTHTLDRYLSLWADPSPDRDLALLDSLTTPDVAFKDAINDLVGRAKLKRIFRDASDAVEGTVIEFDGIAWPGPARAFVKWRYSGRLRRLGNRPWAVTGMSDISFSGDGLIARHEDHWDLASGLYEYFPIIGGLFSGLRRRLRLKH